MQEEGANYMDKSIAWKMKEAGGNETVAKPVDFDSAAAGRD